MITFTSYEMIHRFFLKLSPPEEKKHSKPQPKPDSGIEPRKGSTSPEENDTLDQSVNPSNDRTRLIALDNTDKLTARQ